MGICTGIIKVCYIIVYSLYYEINHGESRMYACVYMVSRQNFFYLLALSYVLVRVIIR